MSHHCFKGCDGHDEPTPSKQRWPAWLTSGEFVGDKMESQLRKALFIAWETLEEISKFECNCSPECHAEMSNESLIAKESMRRIEELK